MKATSSSVLHHSGSVWLVMDGGLGSAEQTLQIGDEDCHSNMLPFQHEKKTFLA